ncbi:MAG: YbaB/EbfC family nucleoid-associated protein [Lachnospiraceae bacterium]|nr:YbaB/EbfC family nucleoid-associated protein [Lachnospiraceae bacterium]
MSRRGGLPGGMIPGGGSNLLKQAQRLQKEMQESAAQLEAQEFSASSGGGAVEATVTGGKAITKLTIKPEVCDPEDVEMLEDLVKAAVNEAMKKADEASSAMMGKYTGGLGLF